MGYYLLFFGYSHSRFTALAQHNSHVKRASAHLDMLQLSTEEMHKLFFGFASVTVGKWSGVTADGESVFSWLVDADENALLAADGNILTD